MPFGQTFDPHDLIVVALLVVLEGVLSIDNALVLGLLARRLPKRLQGRALTYGLVGAFVFRLIAIASGLLKWRIVKLLGGLYLVYVALKHFFFEEEAEEEKIAEGADATSAAVSTSARRFWQTVLVIELTDVAFAVDSIVAAIGVV